MTAQNTWQQWSNKNCYLKGGFCQKWWCWCGWLCITCSEKISTQYILVFTKSVDINFCVFWLAPVLTWNDSLDIHCFVNERKMTCRFVKVSEEEIEEVFLYPSNLVNNKTIIHLWVGEGRWIYTSTLCISVYIHHYSPPLWGIVVYYHIDTGALLGNSPLVKLIQNYIRDRSDIFSIS